VKRLALLVLLALVPAAPSVAGPVDTYPVESFTYWTDNTTRDAQDFGLGQYNFEEGQFGAARRVVQRAPGGLSDPMRALQVTADGVLHNRPDLPYSHWGDVGHPAYMPDFNGNGVFGDSGGTSLDGKGDFDYDTDHVPNIGTFRFPCYTDADGWRPHFLDTSGACDTADHGPFLLGTAREVEIVNARGLVLDATLWFPPAQREAVPGIVFSNGLSSRQEHYYWFAERMAGRGYIVLTWDPAGQGESEGGWTDLFGVTDVNRVDCQFAGECRDLMDVVRWFAGLPVVPTTDAGFRLVPRRDPLSDGRNPALGYLDTTHIALAGNSMGAIGTLEYLRFQAADPASLPPVRAAVSMSGATDTHATVPIQFQTADFDGSPILVGPTVAGADLGYGGEGIGYQLIKERYDLLRASTDAGALSLVVIEGGVHTDHVDVPYVPRTLWGNSVAGDYAQDWLDCHVRAYASACAGAAGARPHLSRAFASEQDPDGAAGPSPSRCITVPDEASLNQRPQDLASAATGSPVYDCTP
jgi:hypothetical protein